MGVRGRHLAGGATGQCKVRRILCLAGSKSTAGPPLLRSAKLQVDGPTDADDVIRTGYAPPGASRHSPSHLSDTSYL